MSCRWLHQQKGVIAEPSMCGDKVEQCCVFCVQGPGRGLVEVKKGRPVNLAGVSALRHPAGFRLC